MKIEGIRQECSIYYLGYTWERIRREKGTKKEIKRKDGEGAVGPSQKAYQLKCDACW